MELCVYVFLIHVYAITTIMVKSSKES